MHLPWAFRLYAAYARLVANPRTGAVKGGAALHRLLAALTRKLGWTDVAMVDIDGLKFAVDLLDLRMTTVFTEVASFSPDVEVLSRYLSSGDTFVDIGANHGSFALRLAMTVGQAGHVVAIEPQPRLAQLVRQSFQANGFTQGAVVECACGDADGDHAFYSPTTSSGTASLFRAFLASSAFTTLTVRQRRLDDVMREQTVTGRVVVKLDIEGAEVGLLRGGRDFLRAHRPPMLLEVNPASLRAAGESMASLRAALADAGYTQFSELDSWPASHQLAELNSEPQRNVLVLHD